MSKFLINTTLLNIKAIVNAYTWSTLPFYALAQRPWNRARQSKSFGLKSTSQNGQTIYYRDSPIKLPSDHYFLKCKTFPEVFEHLDRSKKAFGVRDVIQESLALDENGNSIQIDGKQLKRIELANEFRWQTVGEVLDRVDVIARAFGQLGIKRGDRVLIYAENCVEWLYTCLALARLNAITVTLFSTLNDSGLVYGINQSDATYMITSQNLLAKLNRLSDQFVNLKKVVYIENIFNTDNTEQLIRDLSEKRIETLSYAEMESVGESLPVCAFKPPKPDDIALIMYTSGTTGNPKGVIINHGQFYSNFVSSFYRDMENDAILAGSRYAGYLPMAHAFGYIMNIGMFLIGTKIALCSPFTLLDSSPAHVPNQIGDLKLIRPTFLVAVPLVLDRILKEINHKLEQRSPLAVPLFSYLMDYKIRWTARGFDTPIINRLLCKSVNDQFGGQLRIVIVASAPLNPRTQALVKAALNVQIVQAYGATEMTSASHSTLICDLTCGSVGVPYPSVKYYLKDWPEGGFCSGDEPNPRGEIVVGGDAISSGYYKLTDETKDTFYTDEQGTRWFLSGDIGELLPNGTLKIIDRKKDLTKLPNGEFISLGKIESAIRGLSYVENVCVCIDPDHNYLVALITPNNRSLAELGAKLYPKQEKLTIQQLCTDPAVNTHVLSAIDGLGKKLNYNRREIPVKIKLVSDEWSQENHLLTAAMKMKRKQVNEFYKSEIADLFGNEKNEVRFQ